MNFLGSPIILQSLAKNSRKVTARSRSRHQAILKELAENSLALGDFISAKATTLGMLLQFHTSSLPSSAKTQETLQKILKEFSSPELRLAYAGQPRQIYASSKALQEDIERILPLSLGLIIIVLFAIFRTPRVIIVAFVNVVLSLVWTASFVGLLGHRLNLVTIAFAPILICVGSNVTMVLDRFLSISKICRKNLSIVVSPRPLMR